MRKSKFSLKKTLAIALAVSMSLTTGITSFAATPGKDSALIKNSTFEDGTKDWGIYVAEGSKATMTTKDGKLCINISDVGSLNYGVQPGYDVIPLYKNAKYKLSFDISSTVDRKGECMIQQNGGTYTSYVYTQLNLTSETQHVSKTFTMDYDTDPFAKLVFNIGNQGTELPKHSVYIDNVYLELIDDSRVDYSSTEVKEADILLNQVGYMNNANKIAVFRNVTSQKTFDVIDSKTNEVVYSGNISNKRYNSSSQENNWYGDFSDVTTPGTYYICADDLQDSYEFTISDNVYNDLLTDSVRMLYLQRCGCEVKDKQLNHPACHTSLATISGTNEKIDVSGGWHDAGDYGRYIVAAAKAVADLLLAYDANPTIFKDDTNIPESGNGIPDILDEVRYELEWMLKMQNKSNGGVYHKVSCANFPGYVMPEEETNALIVTPISTTATADFAASMAMAYTSYYDIDRDFANKCIQAAELAYKYLEANPNFIFKEVPGVVTGSYGDTSDKDERFWAAAQLYKATLDQKYENAITQSSISKNTGLDWSTVGDYGRIAYATVSSFLSDPAKQLTTKNAIIASADDMLIDSQDQGYGISIDKYYWGSNMSIANNGIILSLAYKFTGDEKYIDCAKEHLNYLLGKNPLDTCFVSGYGTVSPQNPHHRPSMAINEAVRGMLAGGVNQFLEDSVAKGVLADTAPAKCYIDHSESYSTNEVTIYWNSPLVYLLANIMAPEKSTQTPDNPGQNDDPIIKEDPDTNATSVSLDVINDWGSGCVAEINITNEGSALNNWTLEFDYEREITDIWNAKIVSHKGNHYVIQGLSYSANIGANESLSLGMMCGNGSASSKLENVSLK